LVSDTEEHKLNVMGIRRCGYVDLMRRKRHKTGEDCIMRSFITCIIRVNKSRRIRWTGM
jgi:hypothetical protein